MKNLVFIRVSNSPKMSDSLNAILVLSYFPCSDFPGLLVCDKGDFGEMHTTKIVFADTSTFFANVTGLLCFFLCLLQARLWRKNRKPNKSNSCIGTDLNRNFAYKWNSKKSLVLFYILIMLVTLDQ